MLNPAIEAYLADNETRHLEELFEFLRFPSLATCKDPDGCRPCAQWLAEHLTGLGARGVALLDDGLGQPCVYGEFPGPAGAPTVLMYGHYDVQPADPLDLWASEPFEPVVRDGRIYARGASDDKGQVWMHLMGLEAWLRAGELPVSVKVLIEGEEEIGSPGIEHFFETHKELLAADALVVSDSNFPAAGVPGICHALRGLCYMEVRFEGPNRDLHSGLEGGMVTNPANAIARLVASMADERGRVTIPGFYDDVLPTDADEVASWDRLPFDESEHAAELGVDALGGGEAGLSALERNWVRPTLDCNGLTAGYQGEGAKTVISAWASAKVSMRLAPSQDPEKVRAAFERHVREHTPVGIRATVSCHSLARPVLLEKHGPAAEAGFAAMRAAFEADPVWLRSGASVPITEQFQRVLGLEAVMLGVGLPDDNLHSPNEKFDVDHLRRGARMIAVFLQELADRWE